MRDVILLSHSNVLRLCIFSLTGRSTLILHNRSSFVILIGLASFEPRDYRGVFVYKKPWKTVRFSWFFFLAAFSSAIMVYVTGIELTILTNLLFIMIPQGYLPCAKLLMSLFIKPPVVIFVAANYSASYYTTGGFILYLQDSNSTTLWNAPQKLDKLLEVHLLWKERRNTTQNTRRSSKNLL